MIKNIEIIDYKCFKNLKLDGLSQINVITGGNNVGKTALLEALFIENEIIKSKSLSFNLDSILQIAQNRDVHQKGLKRYLETFIFKVKSDRSFISIGYKNKYELKDGFKKQAEEFDKDYDGFLVLYKSISSSNIFLKPTININYDDYNINFLNYVNSSKPTNQRLVDIYFKIQTRGIQDKFLDYLKITDSNIARIEPYYIDERLVLRVNLSNPKQSLISSEMGDTTNKFIEVLALLLSNPNQIIFIDEIDDAIDYDKSEKIFKAIIEIVKKEKVQLFFTIRDKNKVEVLERISEELEYKNIKFIKLIEK
jgi:AAA15 family ATPase/GTPase